MFEPKKFNDIFEAMRANTLASGALSDFEVGSVTRTLYESFAWEMAALYEKMNLVYLSAFVDTAQGGQLDQVVAILGIKRGEPEFADGEVVFERDKTDDALTVPVGTLVSTEDSPEMPKKVFQTTENVTFGKGQATLEAPVQALIAGEDQDAAIETVTVMPRPVPGVKGVTNRNAILLVGKKRETDDELRRRAKNTLLASGKATTIAIENALLALPGVTDVQVREDFRFAQGRIKVARKTGALGDIEIPLRSRVELFFGGTTPSLFYETIDAVTIPNGQAEVTIDVRALAEGSAGEMKTNNIIFSKGAWRFADAALDGKGIITLSTSIVRGNFGIIRVFVDGPDLANPQATDPAEQQRYQEAITLVRTELDRVRAAGVFAILESARPVLVDLALLIELDASQKPTAAERTELENLAREAVFDYFRQLRMEQPLVYAKLLRTLTDLDGVDNLAELRILTETPRPGLSPVREEKDLPFSKMEVEAYERFLPRDVCVASEQKTLFFDYEFDLSTSNTPTGDEETKFNTIRTALTGQFPTQPGTEVTLLAQPGGFSAEKISIRTWCARKSLNQNPPVGTVSKVQPLFFERAVLGNLFVYFRVLEITGGVRLTLAPTLNAAAQSSANTAAKKVIEDYLAQLPPETPALLDDLKTMILATPGIEEVEIDPDDFRLRIANGPDAQDHLDKKKNRIEVRRFEKAHLDQFLIANGRTNLTVTASPIVANPSKLLKINVFKYVQTAGGALADPTEPQKAAVRNTVAAAVNSFFAAAEIGKDIAFDDFKNALEGQTAGVSYALGECTLTAVSAISVGSTKARSQTISHASPGTIHVRSMELPVMAPITVDNIETTPV